MEGKRMMAKYYTDGSSTIGMKSAFCVTNEKGAVIHLCESKAPEDKTNNEEEYRGVIKALELCQDGDEIYTDSMLVVNQVSGRFKVKVEHLKDLCEQVRALLKQKPAAKLIWIGRDDNLAGKYFEK